MQAFEDCKGWLLTCDRNRQKQALKDAYNFLAEYIEEIYDDLVSKAIQNKLKQQKKELTLQVELKQTKKAENRLLFSIDTKVQCTIFVKINQKFSSKIDPLLVVDKIMEDVNIRKKEITRYCHKILPVQRSFRAEHFKMLEVVDDMFKQKSEEGQIRSWALNFKCRNNSKFNYKEILKQCQKIASKYGHFPDIYYPQWMVSIQITHHLMCISISEKYKEYNEYKLHRKNQQRYEEQEAKVKKQVQIPEINKQEQQDSVQKQQKMRQKLQKEIIKASQDDDFDLI